MRRLRLQLQALRDTATHQGTVLRHAWRHRKDLEPLPLLPLEAQFLPAALELQETPLPAAPHAVLWSIILVFVAAIVWSIFGHVDVVASARGKIVPTDRVKVIQTIDAARVRTIHVVEGQQVRKGDVLVDFDSSNENADFARLASDLDAAKLQVARGRSILSAIATNDRPSLEKVDVASEMRRQDSSRLLQGQFDEYVTKLARIDAQIEQRSAERQLAEDLLSMLEQTVPISRQRVEGLQALVDQHLIPKHDFLLQEQNRIELESQMFAQRSKVLATEASLREARAAKTELIAETQRQNMEIVTAGIQAVEALEQELTKADVRRRFTELRAPVDGTVQQLGIHTIGGVVTQAQPLMVLVPHEPSLEIEAFIENKDIGFVEPGQPVEVKVDAFQYTRYGTIRARVMTISPDALSKENAGLVYSTRLKLERPHIVLDDQEIGLSPGMTVSVEIRTGRRRLIEYFMSPLLQHSKESFHER